MTIWNEISKFLGTITDWVLLLIVFTLFFFTCNVETVTVFGRVTTLPVPSDISFAADFFTLLVTNVAPVSIPLVVTSPMAAFVVQFKLAFLLAIFFTFPVFLLRLLSYLAPALYQHERRLLYALIAPATLLFFLGGYFAYAYLAPATFTILYTFTAPIGAVPLLGVNEFIGLTLALLLMSGIMFTLPVFMVLLTALRALRASFWWQNFRYAFVFFLIVSAIITPDGSGVSMVLLSLPVSALYGSGALVCTTVERVITADNRQSKPFVS